MQVFEEAHSILQREGYRDLLPHVTIVRIPPCDQASCIVSLSFGGALCFGPACLNQLGMNAQILNVVLRGAVCTLQLSHREGFEVKVGFRQKTTPRSIYPIPRV